MERLPKISVFTSVKNGGRFLRETLDSIFEQTFLNFEVVLVDGASTDNTLDVLNDYANEKRLYWISEPDNSAPEGFLKALKMARGEYIMLTGISDGYLDHKWFETCAEILDGDREISLVHALPQIKYEDGRLGSIHLKEYINHPLPSKQEFFFLWLATGFLFNELTYCVRAPVFRQCYPDGSIAVDYDQLLKFCFNFNSNGYLSHFVPRVSSFGRVHTNSITVNSADYLEHSARCYMAELSRYKRDILTEKMTHNFKDGKGKIIDILESKDLKRVRKKILKYRMTHHMSCAYFDPLNIFSIWAKLKQILKKLIKWVLPIKKWQF